MTRRSWIILGVVSILLSTALIASTYVTYVQGGGISSPITLSKVWGAWDYVVHISGTAVKSGLTIDVEGELTFMGPANTSVTIVQPFLALQVYNSSGKLVWDLRPSVDYAGKCNNN